MASNISQNERTLIHLAEQRDTSGAVERRRLESLRRSSFSLNVGTDTLYACLKTPRCSACNASLPHVPVPSRAACWHATVERSRALFKYHRYIWNVNSRHQQPQPGSPLLHAGDCGIHVLPRQRRATQMVVEEHLVTCELPVPFTSKGFKRVHV